MSKVFKLHQGTDVYKDWDVAAKYGQQAISQIEDPDGATAKKEITSIPSPFARIDLVKTAFKYVGADHELHGNTMHHKIVSDCLDIAEIFFNYERYQNLVEILVWDKTTDLPQLLNSANPAHRAVGKTLDMYLNQDAVNYNFGAMERIYLLNYKGPGKPKAINIIGATSPATLFFSSANNLSYASANMRSGNVRFFDEKYEQLDERDRDFILYMYAFRLSVPNFATLFPEVYAYLDKAYMHMRDEIKRDIDNLNASSINGKGFKPIQFGANNVEILGNQLRQRNMEADTVDSDFKIASHIFQAEKMPLVLPVENGNNYAGLRYVQDNWNLNDHVEFSDSVEWQQRTLPFDGRPYPYLTISDFLEDTMIQISPRRSDLKSDSYFDGNRDESVEGSYLLPIKPLFFKFFTPEELMSNVVGGQKMLEMTYNPAAVKVVLRIPVKGGQTYIEYSRLYMNPGAGVRANIQMNIGAIESYTSFALSLYPNLRYEDDADAAYRIGLLTDPTNGNSYGIECFKADSALTLTRLVRNTRDTSYLNSEVFALNGQCFDYIRLTVGGSHGIIAPRFRNPARNSVFKFAIDLGTSNTNVQYQRNNMPAKQFDITPDDIQLQPLAVYPAKYNLVFAADILPSLIGNNQKCSFPTRTALSYSKQVDWKQFITPMAEASMALTYERESEYLYNEVLTNLKWANNSESQLKCYIESLFLLLRTKVLLNNGDLKKTQIVWFYPISMTAHRLAMFNTAWKAAYAKYFGGPEEYLTSMSESVAPYEYFRAAVVNTANTVTVDIGGGTTDVVFADNGHIDYITSFRFAADTIFGDGYADPNFATQNGIVEEFKNQIVDVLKINNQNTLVDVYNTINERRRSTEVASFLFSLCTNRQLKDDPKFNTDLVDFDQILQSDGKLKMVFILFYTAIIYHIACIMKAKEMKMPRYLCFSGNGSKVIRIISTDKVLLVKFTKLVIESVYQEKYNANGLDLILENDPKVVTCSGGISSLSRAVPEEYDFKSIIMRGTDTSSFVDTDTYDQIANDKQTAVHLAAQAQAFFNFVIRLNDHFSFRDNFGVMNEALKTAEDECLRDLELFAQNGINKKMEEVTLQDKIEETMFFYPLVGMLNSLAHKLHEKL